ncbi:MAG: SDR family NAD(P)-dependent oxidoreductase [Paracoccaceae bacterium]
MSILITGANRGIGRALYDGYLDANRAVTGTARTAQSDFLQLDVTCYTDHLALAQQLSDQPIELLVCNAGVYLDKTQHIVDGYPPEMWEKGFATNVMGVFLTVQSLLPNLELAGNARVAILSSQMATRARAKGGSYIYRASKAAVLNLGCNLATDLEPLGIAVGIYHPGWVQTDMGGDRAEISTDKAAAGLTKGFDALNLANTGCFENWGGTIQPD